MVKPVGYGGRDYSDFGAVNAQHSITVLSDMGELAARLGSPMFFERSGVLVFTELFEYGLGTWSGWPTSGTLEPALYSDIYFQKPHSVLLGCNGTTELSSYISKYIPYSYISSFAVQVSFFTRTTFLYLDLKLYLYIANAVYTTEIRIDDDSNLLWYLNSSNKLIEFADYDLGIDAYSQWHVVKLTVDFLNEKYIRFMLDAKDYNISDYAIRKVTYPYVPRVLINLTHTGKVSQTESIYVDHILCTVDEPT